MAAIINAGFIQFQPFIGDPVKNRSIIKALIFKGRDADLLVLPELATSGYNFQSRKEAFAYAENLNHSPTLDFIEEQANRHNLYLVCGINEEDAGHLYNTAVLIGPTGFIGKYRKVHLFWNEFDYFEAGNMGFPVFETPLGRLGILICFDWVFPEAWRILALKGADVICHPSNLVLPYAQQAVPVHSMINRIFTITANRYGEERGLLFSGRSIITSPEGKTLYEGPSNKEAVIWRSLHLDQARNKQITPRNHVFFDRIPDAYSALLNNPESFTEN